VNGIGARIGDKYVQEHVAQVPEESPEVPQKRQHTRGAISCMMEEMKTCFDDDLKTTERLPIRQR
jgi:hypothetical protein